MTLALAKLLQPPSNMAFCASEETRDEGYKPGLRLYHGEAPDSAILVNATYNNYTITNHYRSKEQIEVNEDLHREIKDIRKKYDAAKKLLCQLGPLVEHIPLARLDTQTRKNVTDFNTKWQQTVEKKNKKKRQANDSYIENDDETPCKRSRQQTRENLL